MANKTGAPLKAFFEPAKVQAAQAQMQPTPLPAHAGGAPPAARNRKTGGRGVRVSGYLPVEISEALRDEVIRRTVSARQTISFNDVLCSILTDWYASRPKGEA